MSSSNTDSENSFEYEDSDGCYVSEYDIAFEDGDLNDMRVTPSTSEESVDSLDQIYADLCFYEINPLLATFNSLGSRITKERYGVHKYAFGRIRDIAFYSSLCTIIPISSPADVTDQTRPTLLQTRR